MPKSIFFIKIPLFITQSNHLESSGLQSINPESDI
jgi:hypothetical protein